MMDRPASAPPATRKRSKPSLTKARRSSALRRVGGDALSRSRAEVLAEAAAEEEEGRRRSGGAGRGFEMLQDRRVGWVHGEGEVEEAEEADAGVGGGCPMLSPAVRPAASVLGGCNALNGDAVDSS